MESVKNLKKELKSRDKSFNDIETINVKVKHEEEIYSGYNYDRNEVLNPALSDFLVEKAESLHKRSKLRIKIFSDFSLEEHELFSAIKNKFKGEFESYERKLKQTAIFSLVVLILGILFLGIFVLEEMFFHNVVLSIILGNCLLGVYLGGGGFLLFGANSVKRKAETNGAIIRRRNRSCCVRFGWYRRGKRNKLGRFAPKKERK